MIEFNDILRNDTTIGVVGQASVENTIFNNRISNNGREGIRLSGDDNAIVGNRVNGNSVLLEGSGGILIAGSGNLVAHNRVNRNGGDTRESLLAAQETLSQTTE
jgi:parallel beta-helix repeat protein